MCELLGVSSLHPVILEMSFQSLMQRAKVVNPDGLHPPGLYHNTRHCDQQRHSIPCVGLTIQSASIIAQAPTLIASVPLSDEAWIPFEKNQLLVIENCEILDAK